MAEKKYRIPGHAEPVTINAPDGATDEQVMEILANMAREGPAGRALPVSPEQQEGILSGHLSPSLSAEADRRIAARGPRTQAEAGEPGRPWARAGASFAAAAPFLMNAARGAAMGAPGGPPGMALGAGANLAGGLIMGAAGSGVGDQLYDNYRTVRRDYVDDPTIPPTTAEQRKNALGTFQEDLLMGGAVSAIPAVGATARAIGRGLTGIKPGSLETNETAKALGIGVPPSRLARGVNALAEGANDAAFNHLGIGFDPQRIARTAQTLGLDNPEMREGLGIGQAAEGMMSTVPRIYTQTVSRMPWLGGPYKKNQANMAKSWEAGWNRELNAIGPSQDAVDLSRNIKQDADHAFEAAVPAINLRYEAARRAMETEGTTAPADAIQRVVGIAQRNHLGKAPLSGAPLEEGEQAQRLLPAISPALTQRINNLAELPDNLTAQHLDYVRDVANNLSKMKEEPAQELAAELRRAADTALRQMAPESNAARLIAAADDFSARTMRTFETPVAQKFGRIEKNIFDTRVSRPGTLNSDELYDVLKNIKSPQGVDDLTNLVGRENVGALARRKIDEAAIPAMSKDKNGNPVFDVVEFRKGLGIEDKTSPSYKAFAKMLKQQGSDIRDFERVLGATEKLFANQVPDTSTYVARSAMMQAGSKPGLWGAMAATGGAIAGKVLSNTLAGATALLLGRFGSSIFSNPKYLNRLAKGLDMNTPDTLRRETILRMARDLGDQRTEERKVGEAAAQDAEGL